MKHRICAICQNSTQLYKLNDFDLKLCEQCHFATLEPYPTEEVTKQIYSENYFDNKKATDHIKDSKKKWYFVEKYLNKEDSLLDFGCGTGNFLREASKIVKTHGYDVSNYAAEYVKQTLGTDVTCTELSKDTFNKNSFNVIVSFDVIEHLTNYAEVLEYFNKWLKKDGLIILTTPDLDSWDAKVLGKHWYGFKKFPEHVNYFSKRSLTILLEEKGFKVTKIKTWGFVRSLEFIILNGFKNLKHKDTIISLMKKLKINNLNVYIPMTDMLVVAQKVRSL